MTIELLHEQKLVVFECISGSRSYGLDLPGSDTDIKGIYILPKTQYYGLEYVEQISNESNDVVYYELKRFCELLARNNPNILELLAVPEECVLYRHPVMEQLQPHLFVSKLCRQTFANYALSQIKKARGLNKKIHKPLDKERRTILDFCYVTQGTGSIPLQEWLQLRGYQQEQCGLAAMNHMRDVYALFVDSSNQLGYGGVMSKQHSNEVTVSAIPKGQPLAAYLYFNKDAYSVYCKEYKEYWEWVEKRNEQRYQNTLQHGKNYDTKNMMHVFRLLDMAEEIALGQGIITKRPNREELLRIRSGEFEYEELLARAEAKMQRIDTLFEQSPLPETPDAKQINTLLVSIRDAYYASK